MSTQALASAWEIEEPKQLEWEYIEERIEIPVLSPLEAGIEFAEERLLALEENWDGEHSPGYAKDTLDRAAMFLRVQDQLLWELRKIRLPVPNINPGPDGSIDLFWEQVSWELLVNIPATRTQAASFYGEGAGAGMIKGNLDTSEPNVELTLWLMKS